MSDSNLPDNIRDSIYDPTSPVWIGDDKCEDQVDGWDEEWAWEENWENAG